MSFPRPIKQEEADLIRWVLSNAPNRSEAPHFQADQINALVAVGNCDCGCPTVNFARTNEREDFRDSRVVLEATGTSGEVGLVGVLLFIDDGEISMLEVFAHGNSEHRFPLPTLESLRPGG